MGLSKIFPSRKWRQEKHKAEQGADSKPTESTSQAQNQSKNENPPARPTVANVSDNPEITTSERVWNRAYDELAADSETAGLVEAYMKILPKAIDPDASATDELSLETDDPVQRQVILKSAVDRGRARIDKSIKATNVVGSALGFINEIKGVIDLAVSGVPQAALPWAGVCVGLQFFTNSAQASQTQMSGLSYVITRMNWYCQLTNYLLDEDKIDPRGRSHRDLLQELEGRIVTLYKALLKFQMKSACSYQKNQAWVFLKNTINWDNWGEELQAAKDAELALDKDTKSYLDVNSNRALTGLVQQGQESQRILGDFHQTVKDYFLAQQRTERSKQETDVLQDIYVIDPDAVKEDIARRNDELLPAAYKWILNTSEYQGFTDWSDPDAARVLWVNGPTGTGKSMLVIGILNELAEQSSSLAPGLSYFFFESGEPHQTRPMDALRSLVWMLLIQQPNLFPHIFDSCRNAKPGHFDNPRMFWGLAKAFQNMLADKSLGRVYLALDALDECDDGGPGIRDIQKVIQDALKNTKKARWILSSRPEVDMFRKLKIHVNPASIIGLDVQSRPEPVNAYIEFKLCQLKDEFDYDKAALQQMSTEIHERAQNTFLWVSLIFKGIFKYEMSQARAIAYIQGTPSDLTAVYDKLMAKIEHEDPYERKCCVEVLAVSCLSSRPLSSSEIHLLADLPVDIKTREILPRCGSFLAIKDDTVRVIHKSARDYLNKYMESHSEARGVNQRHIDIGTRSISEMSKVLKRNIYNISQATPSKDVLVPEDNPLFSLRYSCEFGFDHLCKGEDGPTNDKVIIDFLDVHFLHWLESLSLIQRLPSALLCISQLLAKFRSHENSRFAAFLEDAHRFLKRNMSIIKETPLQAYAAALALSPAKSCVRMQYWHERLPFIKDVKGVREEWDPCLMTIQTSEGTKKLELSPDCQTLASFWRRFEVGSESPAARVFLWDTDTGACKNTLMIPVSNAPAPVSMAFSLDSKTLFTVCEQEVCLWDVLTGEDMERFDLPGIVPTAAAFSPDCTALAFAQGGTIEIWDLATKSSKRTIDTESTYVQDIDFSLDGVTLAAVLADYSVGIWDTTDGSCKPTLLPHDNFPAFINLSPDGKTLSTTTVPDGTMRLWDVATGTCREISGAEFGDARFVRGVFFPNGKDMALLTGDLGTTGACRFDVVDVASRSEIRPLGFGASSSLVAFSEDGSVMVTASLLGLIHFYDTTSQIKQNPIGHDRRVTSVKPLPEGKLATASHDKTVKLWNVEDKSWERTLEGHDYEIGGLALSPDGKTLASGAINGEIRIWDTATGACKHTLGIFENDEKLTRYSIIRSLTFSPTGSLLIGGKANGMLKIWDTATWECKYELEASRELAGAAISRDDKILFVGAFQGEDTVWDVTTKTRKQLGETGRETIRVAISSDGNLLAAGRFDHVQVWNATGSSDYQPVTEIPTKTYTRKLVFSRDDSYLIMDDGFHKVVSGIPGDDPDPDLSQSEMSLDESWWVVRGGRRVLQLPPDYHKLFLVVSVLGNTLILADDSGQIVLFELSES